MRFTKEIYCSELLKELAPIIKAHRNEISLLPGSIPTEPNWPVYEQANAIGALHVYTVRDEDCIVGYMVYLTCPHQHYVSQLVGEPDVIYILPKARKGMVGRDFIRFVENDLLSHGVNILRQVVKPSVRNFGPLLKREGYELTEHIWTKRLK